MTRARSTARGSVSIELLVALPMFAALWVLSIYAFGFHAERTANQRHVRRCAWAYAVSGCTAMPPDCDGVPGGAWLRDAELRSAASGGFDELQARIPALATLSSLHGSTFTLHRTEEVHRPAAFGGSVPAEATYHLACATPTAEWTTPAVVGVGCRSLGVARWCP